MAAIPQPDRVVGALDLERALAEGVKSFEPGLLARAHRGFLYIDEVNLLEDHIVDLLLDVAEASLGTGDFAANVLKVALQRGPLQLNGRRLAIEVAARSP